MSQKYIKFTLYFIIVVLLNMVSDTLFVRYDLTENKMFSISGASKDLVKNLTVPLTIKVFFTPDLPAPHNNTERYLRDLLEEYANYGNKNFNYEFLSVSAKKDQSLSSIGNQSVAESYDIKPSGIQIIEEDQRSIKYAYRGLVMINGDMIEKIPVIDTVEGLEYKITTAMRRLNNKISVLSALKGKIDVTFYMSDSLIEMAPIMQIPDISKAPDQIREKVEELNRKYFNKISYRYINPSKETSGEIQQKLKEDRIFTLAWNAMPKKNIKEGNGSIGLVIRYGENRISLPVLDSVEIPIFNVTKYQYSLNEALEFMPDYLEAVVDINQNIGFLSSHSGTSLRQSRTSQQPSFDSFDTVLSGNYTVKEIDLAKDAIGDKLKCLIIANPTKKFSDYELYQIDQALMKGTNLAFFIDQFEEKPAPRQMQMMGVRSEFAKIDTGLEKLLEHYGVVIKKSVAYDEECYKPIDPQQGEIGYYYVPIIKNDNINSHLPFMKDLKGLATMIASPLTITEKRRNDPDLRVFRLFTTSEKSWEVKDNFNFENPKSIVVPQDSKTKGKKDMAYLLEGDFESYFKGKEIPVKKLSEEESKKIGKKGINAVKAVSDTGFVPKRSNGRIFVTGTSRILGENLIDKDGASPNAVFAMNVIDYLNDLESIAIMRSKTTGYNPLAETDFITKSIFKGFNIVGLPLIVLLFGGIVWLRRSARKKALKKEFMKS